MRIEHILIPQSVVKSSFPLNDHSDTLYVFHVTSRTNHPKHITVLQSALQYSSAKTVVVAPVQAVAAGVSTSPVAPNVLVSWSAGTSAAWSVRRAAAHAVVLARTAASTPSAGGHVGNRVHPVRSDVPGGADTTGVLCPALLPATGRRATLAVCFDLQNVDTYVLDSAAKSAPNFVTSATSKHSLKSSSERKTRRMHDSLSSRIAVTSSR